MDELKEHWTDVWVDECTSGIYIYNQVGCIAKTT